MGCNQSTATDTVHDKSRAGETANVSKQYGPPQSSGRGPMPTPGSSNGVPQVFTGSPAVPPPIPEEKGKMYIARFAYQARTSEDLSFEKGEKLRVSYCCLK